MSEKLINSERIDWRQSADQDSLAEVLAERVQIELIAAIKARGHASLAVSGGSTPKKLFQALARKKIPWQSVIITLVDERAVPATDELSNALFLQLNLFQHLAEAPQFVPLYSADERLPLNQLDSEMKIAVTSMRAALKIKDNAQIAFDVCLLGMGEDGHTASFFPDADNIEQLVDIGEADDLLSCHSESSQVPRITWSLPLLLNSRFAALHIHGDKKAVVLERALKDMNATELPIRAVLFNLKVPLPVFFAA